MIALEQLRDGSLSDRNFQKLAALVVDTGGQSLGIRCGTATLTWAGASALSDTLTVSHGLGGTPTVITFGAGPNSAIVPRWNSKGATSFDMAARDVTGTPAAGTTRNVDWFVIG